VRTVLVVLGVAFDLAGIVLIGAADVMPGLRRRAARFAAWLDRLWRWFRRVMLRRPTHVTHQASIGGAVALGGRIAAVTGTSATTLEGKVDYLLRESERTQHRLNDLERTTEERHEQLESDLARLNRELVDHVDQALRIAFAEYATARRLGIACLGVALALWTIAAFL
jgi:hypothetical protein